MKELALLMFFVGCGYALAKLIERCSPADGRRIFFAIPSQASFNVLWGFVFYLGFAALVIFAGRAIVRRSHVLRKFAIPAPVISGLLFSVLIAIFKGTGILAISVDTNVSQGSASIVSCMSMRWGGLTVAFPLRLM